MTLLSPSKILLADEADQRLQKRITELEAENQALRKISSDIQAALKSVPESTSPATTEGPADENLTFEAYLSGWHKRVPDEHKPFVKKVAAEFGFELAKH